MTHFSVLPGLPTTGDPAIAYPPDYGRLGREGFVVRITPDSGQSWTANFRTGLSSFSTCRLHPDGRHLLVIACGEMYVLDPSSRTLLSTGGGAITQLWELIDPPSVLISHQDIYLERIGPSGSIWYTRRLSFDGFREVAVTTVDCRGLGWNATTDAWEPFLVDLRTGRTATTAYPFPEAATREQLAC